MNERNNVYFNILVTSRDRQASRLGLVFIGDANVLLSSHSCANVL